jgi:hypothetical protein
VSFSLVSFTPCVIQNEAKNPDSFFPLPIRRASLNSSLCSSPLLGRVRIECDHGKMAQVSARNYLWRFVREVVRQAFQFSKDNVWPQVIAVATFLFQVVFETSSSADFHANVLATLWAFGFAFGVYIIVQIIRAPMVLDRQRAEQIQEIAGRLGDPVSVEFRSITFEHAVADRRSSRMRLDMVIRTSDSPATLAEWSLRSQKNPELKPLLAHIWGLGRHVGGNTIRLDDHDHQGGAILFDLVGQAQASEDEARDANHKWTFEFRDAHRSYAIEIPERLYAPIRLTGHF